MATIDERAEAVARRVTGALLDVAGPAVVGVYVHGSAVLADFVPGVSDLDLLVTVADGTERAALDRIVRTLSTSSAAPAIGLEASVVSRAAASCPQSPWPFDAHVTNGPRDPKVVYGAGHPGDPDLILHYAVTRDHGWAAAGPDARALIGAIDRPTIVRQLVDELLWATTDAPPEYAVLNACRALRYVDDGVLCSKTDGGQWALDAGIEPGLVEPALRARRGESAADIDRTAVRDWVRSVAARLDPSNA